MKKFLTGSLLLSILVYGCKPDPEVVPDKQIIFTVPQGWPAPHYQFENNTLTTAGFELGRKLFYDTRLSSDNTISCATCHQPVSAFAQIGHDFSHGVNDQLGTRNSPALFNLNWYTSFFWDGGVNHIENQPINPIQNPVEMNETLQNLISKLSSDEDYKTRFKRAFGSDTINSQRIFKALSQFMGMLVSSNSKYDHYMRGEAEGIMTDTELKGMKVFQDNCAHCHTPPLFTDFSFRNDGLAPSPSNDSGRGRITGIANDIYKFKVPTLRNLRYTAPYMHDGRFNTLDEVLDHYATGIENMRNVDAFIRAGLPLTEEERKDLLAFLNTLNDETFVNDPRFRQQ